MAGSSGVAANVFSTNTEFLACSINARRSVEGFKEGEAMSG